MKRSRSTRPHVSALALAPIAVLGLAFAGAAHASQEAEAAGAAADSSAKQEARVAELLAPLSVNGVEIGPQRIKRALLYSMGAKLLKAKQVEIFIQEEIRRQVAAGESRDSFAVTDDEVRDAEAEMIQQIRDQYPDLEPEDVIRINDMDAGNLGEQVAQAKLFQKVFLPENPDEWPETTMTAITESAGEEFVQRVRDSYEAQQAEGGENPSAQGQALFRQLMQQMVMQFLEKGAVIRTASDGLPGDVALEVNGIRVSTDDLFEEVRGRITDEDVRTTRLWLAKTEAAKQELEAKDALLAPEEFRALFEEHEKPYVDSPFNLQLIALGFKKFPSMDAYKTYWRLQKSFERSIEGELDDEHLAEHMDRASRLLGLATVDCEVVLCSAYDFAKGRWKEDGWERAAGEAQAVVDELVAGGEWDAVLEEHSDFWDPPAPRNAQVAQPQNRQLKNGGRFGALNRNELVQRLGESDFSMFLEGSSVADTIFFDQEVDSVDGPFQGMHGYYVTRVLARGEPRRRMSLENPKERELIVQDYLTVRFNAFARRALGRAEVAGL